MSEQTTTSTDTRLTTIGFMQRMVEGWTRAHTAHHQGQTAYRHTMPVVFDRAMREAALSSDEIADVAHCIVDWMLDTSDLEDPESLTDILYDLTEMLFALLPVAARRDQAEPCDHDDALPSGDCPTCVLELFATLRAGLLANGD